MNSHSNLIKILVGSCLTLTLSVSSVSATTVLLDLGRDGSETDSSEDPQSRTWNNLSDSVNTQFFVDTVNPLIADLLDTDGNTTTIDLFLTSLGANSEFGVAGRNVDNGATPFDYPADARRDQFFLRDVVTAGAQTATFEIRGLQANALYDVSMFSAIDLDRPDVVFTIDSDSQSFSPTGNTSNIAAFTNIAADSSGVISFDLSSAGVGTSHFGVLEISAVIPEASHYGILGGGLILGAVMLIKRRKR